MWLAWFSSKAQYERYFEEHHSDDDEEEPISSFARDMETWFYDHDFVERGFHASAEEDPRLLFFCHPFAASFANDARRDWANAERTRGGQAPNTLILVFGEQFERPRSVEGDGYWLTYLDRHERWTAQEQPGRYLDVAGESWSEQDADLAVDMLQLLHDEAARWSFESEQEREPFSPQLSDPSLLDLHDLVFDKEHPRSREVLEWFERAIADGAFSLDEEERCALTALQELNRLPCTLPATVRQAVAFGLSQGALAEVTSLELAPWVEAHQAEARQLDATFEAHAPTLHEALGAALQAPPLQAPPQEVRREAAAQPKAARKSIYKWIIAALIGAGAIAAVLAIDDSKRTPGRTHLGEETMARARCEMGLTEGAPGGLCQTTRRLRLALESRDCAAARPLIEIFEAELRKLGRHVQGSPLVVMYGLKCPEGARRGRQEGAPSK